MPLQRSHGRRYPQAPRSDELPTGVQAIELAEAGDERRPDGTFAPGASTSQRKGGRAHKATTALSHRAGLGRIVSSDAFAPYLVAAKAFAKAHTGQLARSVGAGFCGPGPSSIVMSAALQLAGAQFLFAKAAETNDPTTFAQASKLANDSRQNLISALDLCANEAKARPPAIDPHEALRAAFAAEAM